MTVLPTYLTIYPDWLTNQHTCLSVWVNWPTNIPAYPCRLTDRPTYLIISIRVDWPTNMPEYLSELTDRHQPICSGWLTNQHTSLSISVDRLTNIPDYLSRMTDQPTYLTIQVDWSTNIPAFSIWADWLIPDYLPLLKFVYCQLLTSACLLVIYYPSSYTVIFLSFRTDRPGQTVQTQIRLLLEAWSGSTLFAIPSASFGCITLRKSHLFNF